MKRMNEAWTADIVGRLHRINMTQAEFAYFCGITPGYLSMVLNGKKQFTTEYAKQCTRRRLDQALTLIEKEYHIK